MRFMVTTGTITGSRFIEFLKRLIHNADRHIYFVVDGHPVHKGKEVRKFIESTDGRLWLFFLPSYYLELNPDELV